MNIGGFECGIGSMLIPSKELGNNIVCGIDSRNIFHTGTFEKNFGISLEKSKLTYSGKIDILFSHPSCGDFSKLNTGKNKGKKIHKGFSNLVNFVKLTDPDFFVVDNLPLSLDYYPLTWWSNQLKGYDLTVEYISNYDYGNVQKNRNRLFLIGSKREFEYVFIPGTIANKKKTRDVLKGVENTKNHDIMNDLEQAPGFSPYNIGQTRSIIKTLVPGKNVNYIKSGDTIKYTNKSLGKTRIGLQILHVNKYSPTITGSLAFYRNDFYRPLTCRERARIQGIPDWFEFVFDRDKVNSAVMGGQTGKCIPVEFVTFLTKQIMDHINGNKIKIGNRTVVDQKINQNKYENCLSNKHSNQGKLCKFCDIHSCNIRI